MRVQPRTHSERRVASLIRSQMAAEDVLLEGVRFTDSQAGDVEIDLLLFLADHGIAAIEVKGGNVEYVDGDWWCTTRRGRRRIRPIDQARRAKHSLRSYFGRQGTWPHALPRTEWFVALPNTEVAGDMGPEGRREQILGRRDLENLVPTIREELAKQSDNSHIISATDIDDALSLLRNQISIEKGSADPAPRSLPMLILIAAAAAVATGFLIASLNFGTSGIGVTSAVAALTGVVLVAPRFDSMSRKAAVSILAGLSLAAAALLGFGLAALLVQKPTLASECQAGYAQCLPIVADLDCSDISGTVEVTGIDVYGLDADGDGTGCEWNRPAQSASA